MGEAAVLDDEAEAVLNAFRGRPKRVPWYAGSATLRQPGVITADGAARARNRALSRLRRNHEAEFQRLWLDEQWKIADGLAE